MTTVSDALLIAATFAGPIAAVQAQKWIERSREKRQKRLVIFHMLMATRAARANSTEHVQALNSIDLFFDGTDTKERAVRNAWGVYLDHLNVEMGNMTPDQVRIHNDRAVDLLVELLHKISEVLGYDFTTVQLKRGGYYPLGHFNEVTNKAAALKGLADLFTRGQSFPMKVTAFPFSEDALKSQQAVQDAIIRTLSGESPLKVQVEKSQE